VSASAQVIAPSAAEASAAAADVHAALVAEEGRRR